MLNAKDRPSENNCSDCARYRKQIARIKKAFIDADDESVRRCMQYEDKNLELIYERSYVYRLLEDSKAEIEHLKAEHSSGSQSVMKVLEEVGNPDSNTSLRAQDPLNSQNKENGH